MNLPEARRPLASRSTRWAGLISRTAVRAGLSADGISILSLVFAAAGAASLLTLAAPWNLLAGAACVQMRLLCNLIDGMVAIEGGKKSRVGVLYNGYPIASPTRCSSSRWATRSAFRGWAGSARSPPPSPHTSACSAAPSGSSRISAARSRSSIAWP